MMKKDNSENLFEDYNLSRRSFVKNCVLAAGALGLSTTLLAKPVAAAEKTENADGLKIIILGSGSPTFNKKRIHSGLLVQYKDKYYQVDVGAGTVRQAWLKGVPLDKIETMFITHQHSDHNLDYGNFLIYGWTNGRQKLNVFSTPGIEKIHQFYLDSYQEDIDYRVGLGRSDKGIRDAVVRELSGTGSLELDGMKISYTEVPHTIYALAYRFDTENGSVVVSGDSTYSENLIKLAQDADIFVGEGLVKEGEFYSKRPPSFKKGIEKSHATIEQMADMAAKANVKKLVITHLAPNVNEEQLIAQVSQIYKGTIVVAEDLMEITK